MSQTDPEVRLEANRTHDKLFARALDDLARWDPYAHSILSFHQLWSQHIGDVCRQYVTASTLIGDRKYLLNVTDVQVSPSVPIPSDCFRFGLSLTVSVTGTLQLHIRGVDPDDPPQLVASVETLLARIPCPVGRDQDLFHAAVSADDTELAGESPLPSSVFIIHGRLRTLPPIKQMLLDTPLLTELRDSWRCQVRSTHFRRPFRSTSTLELHIPKRTKSSASIGFIAVYLPFLPSSPLHLGVIAQALGAELETFVQLIVDILGQDFNEVLFRQYIISLRHHPSVANVRNQRQAILQLSRLYSRVVYSTGVNLSRGDVFPHCILGDDAGATTMRRKVFYLAYCTAQLILFRHGRHPGTPRDDYTSARITTSAEMVGQLFRTSLIAHVATTSKLLRRSLLQMAKKPSSTHCPPDLAKLFGEPRLSARIISAMANGIWSATRRGISIPANNNNTDALLCQLNRISSSLSSTDGVHTGPRALQPTQFGYTCAASTPDGESVGLVYEMARGATLSPDICQPHQMEQLVARILVPIGLKPIRRYLKGRSYSVALLKARDAFEQGIEEPSPTVTDGDEEEVEGDGEDEAVPTPSNDPLLPLSPDAYLFINVSGSITHVVESTQVETLIQTFREARRNGILPMFCFLSVLRARRTIRVLCQSGLLCRPLVVLSRLHHARPNMTLRDMLLMGIVEYVTPAEEQTICRIYASAGDRVTIPCEEATHMELSQTTWLSDVTAATPFTTSQQGPRAAYWSHQSKQLMSMEPKRPRGAVTTTQLWNAHRSLVSSAAGKRTGADIGRYTPCILAWAAVQGVQEDAIWVNKASVERGLMAASTTRVYTSDSNNVSTNVVETFERPSDVIAKKTASYAAIGENGLPRRGATVAGGDIIIGKTRTIKRNPQGGRQQRQMLTRRDISTVTCRDESGTVGHISSVSTPSGRRVVTHVVTARFPIVADKLSSRYAQKGVISQLVPAEDMIFSMRDGTTPDVICSPLSITSRLTMSSLLEALTGKAVAVSGDLDLGVDPQHFDISNRHHVSALGRVLAKYGFRADGKEMYMDGRTGEVLEVPIFVGVVDMARLVHLAAKKIHARALTGPRDPLSRQPRDGRRQGGGLRFGELEGAAVAAHGASAVLRERLCDLSDATTVAICARCHVTAIYNRRSRFRWCTVCQSHERIVRVKLPFGLLILMTELRAIGVTVEVMVDEEGAQADGVLLGTDVRPFPNQV